MVTAKKNVKLLLKQQMQSRSNADAMPPLVLITGGGRGIGAAIAHRLAQDGYDIWLNYRSGHDTAHAVQQEIQNLGRECTLLPFDVADAEAVTTVLTPLLRQRVPAILINNAGITRDGIFAMMSPDDWHAVINTSLNGFYNVTNMVLPLMQRKRCGHVLNVTSVSGQTGVGGQANYSAAKAALIGVTRSLAVEVGKRGIRINAVAPGFIASDMTASLPKDKIEPHIPLKRFGTPEEVAALVSFLCSPKAAYITGQTVGINGGIFM